MYLIGKPLEVHRRMGNHKVHDTDDQEQVADHDQEIPEWTSTHNRIARYAEWKVGKNIANIGPLCEVRGRNRIKNA